MVKFANKNANSHVKFIKVVFLKIWQACFEISFSFVNPLWNKYKQLERGERLSKEGGGAL